MSAAPKKTPTAEQAAIIDAAHNDTFLVVAGAGSGKTFTMTERIIHLIDEGVPPQHILGLTFTRKAASELLQRVSGAYTSTLNTQQTNTAARFMKPEVLTYDAFFQGIVRQYGLLVGFDQNVQPLSEAGARQLISDVVSDNVDRLIAAPDDYQAFTTVVDKVYALANDIASSMIGNDCHTFADACSRIHEWDQAFITLLESLIGDRKPPEDTPKIVDHPKKRTKKETDTEYLERVEEWKAGNEQQGELIAVNTAYDLLSATRKREMLLSLVEQYAQAKQQRHMAEFSDFTIAAFQLVTQFPSIGEQYRRRYSHVLLDEYQDTSTTQASLLAALFHTSEDQAVSPAAVGAVGDPFQSIYAWRGASPGAFRMFQRDFGLPPTYEPLPITMTRRNSVLVLEAANALTMPLRRVERRRSSSPMREVNVPELTAFNKDTLGTVGVQRYATRGEEIDGIVRFVHEVQQRYAKLDESGKDPDAPHVALLFRSKTHMDEYRTALEATGLSVQVVGKSALLDRAEVRDVLALLHSASDHTDAVHLLRLLATPRYHVSSEDLEAFANLAERLNTEQRFRILLESGLISDKQLQDEGAEQTDIPYELQRKLVREYRDRLPNSVFLIDALMHDDLETLLEQSNISEQGRASITAAAQAVMLVQQSMHGPLDEAVRVAAEALNLDVDMVVAAGLQGRTDSPASIQSPLDALQNLVTTYVQEISSSQNVTLRGFLSWIDSLNDAQDTTTQGLDAVCDVVLMTVHQSKGLEWDAVVIPSLEQKRFPSNVGDQLKIVASEGDDAWSKYQPGAGALEAAKPWQAPTYVETATTWITREQSVPVPVRVDANILPQFPHDAADGNSDDETGAVDPIAALQRIDSLESLDDELQGTLRATQELAASLEGIDINADDWYLTQQEEYGRRLHADERRLMYVAVTRAKKSVLLTESENGLLSRDERKLPPKKPAKAKKQQDQQEQTKASNFLLEVADVMQYMHGGAQGGIVDTPTNITPVEEGSEQQTPEALGFKLPKGFFVGDNAQEFENAVVGNAWNEELPEEIESDPLEFPTSLSPELEQRLAESAQLVRDAMTELQKRGDSAQAAAMELPQESTMPLTTQALKILHDVDLGASAVLRGEALDREVSRKAAAVMRTHRLTVTTVQSNAGEQDTKQRRAFERSLVRPIPRVTSAAAEAGTRLHSWAERFMKAGSGESLESQATMINSLHHAQQKVEAEIKALAEADQAAEAETGQVVSTAEQRRELRREKQMLTWQQRLAESQWSSRQLEAAEQSVVMAVPAQAPSAESASASSGAAPSDSTAPSSETLAVMPGKLDAVFRGRLDGTHTEDCFTIVDWKTGHRPVGAADIEKKLRQLDFYRLLWSRMRSIPIEQIDAALYYVSEAEESQRTIVAEPKSEQQILEELSSGIPQSSDED
ncbi:UvrD/REP helicase [Bifidobacterium dolichotidis]|uniref:DNA 3'-5' helicase n=1 Tax=Bifidobacterium dolichotidis TaxID=2306976 RepID=A0A430FRR1_9BIFI|nr:ATP-dependent DNA helicase [Bifidobacterium dolichotidis]RSX55572.1 UvrD/REP helicase [Bifidobacterium dolichotidis]